MKNYTDKHRDDNELRAVAAAFLNRQYPAGWGESSMKRAIKAIKREERGEEIGALEREFS